MLRSFARLAGPVSIWALVVGLAALWLLARPAGQDSASYAGQLLGAEAVLLWSIGLVLISTLPFVEDWFDGIDRAAIWHRGVAIAGLVVLVPHMLLATSEQGRAGALGVISVVGVSVLIGWAVLPRWRSFTPAPLRSVVERVFALPLVARVAHLVGGYELWREVHRITGVFVGIGVAHALIDGTPYDDAPILRWSVAVPGVIGLVFYVYRELLARRFGPLHDYQVSDVRPLRADLIEVVLEPLGPPIRFTPGQFALVYLESKQGWQRHPFTMASSPHERELRLTIKALGDYTSALHGAVQRGMPAVVGGPFGRFRHTKGTGRQIWVAGGVGITPFLSWIRALPHEPTAARIDLFYTAAGEAAYADELRAAAADHEQLAVHLIDTTTDGRLTAAAMLQRAGAEDAGGVSVFMCGPTPMVDQLQRDFRAAGVRKHDVHREHFEWR